MGVALGVGRCSAKMGTCFKVLRKKTLQKIAMCRRPISSGLGHVFQARCFPLWNPWHCKPGCGQQTQMTSIYYRLPITDFSLSSSPKSPKQETIADLVEKAVPIFCPPNNSFLGVVRARKNTPTKNVKVRPVN